MKEKIKRWISEYSNVVITYIFWGYLILYSLFLHKLNVAFAYAFCLLMGIYLGYKIAVWSYDYLKKNKHPPHESS